MLDDKSSEPDLAESASLMTGEAKDRDKSESRLERARIHLLDALTALRGSTLSTTEAAAVESAIEDELIALRIGLLCGR